MNSVTVHAPATVANVGSAFDVLGFALDGLGDTVTATQSSVPGVRLVSVEGDEGRLPRETGKNTAGVSALALLRHLVTIDPARYSSVGIELRLLKGLPVGSGLGSSSASCVAAVVAVNELLGSPLPRKDLLPFAMEGERVACGSAHADNAAPALLGGFILIRSYDPLDSIALPAPPSLWVTVSHPHITVRTEDARRILRRSVPLEQAIAQWGNVAALVAGIYQDDPALMGRALEDKIIVPERAQLIPGFDQVVQAAVSAGALGCSISGSGPSLFALSSSSDTAELICRAMNDAFAAIGIEATGIVSRINSEGARVISKETP